MSKKGFTLVEVLLSLSITLLIVLNCSLLVKVLKISNQSKYIDTSLENAIFSLSNELITAKNIEYGDSLSFLDENDDSHKIILQNKRLVITPGHHILYHDIDSVYFENTNGFIKINLMSNNKEYQFIVLAEDFSYHSDKIEIVIDSEQFDMLSDKAPDIRTIFVLVKVGSGKRSKVIFLNGEEIFNNFH